MSEVLICWEEHFQKHLNRKFPHESLALDSITVNISEKEPERCFTIEEIVAAIKETKSKKAPGIDEITAEAIAAGGAPMQLMLETGTSLDVSRRISLAAVAFGRLQDSIRKKRNIPKGLKIRLYKALIIPIATYAAETWSLKKEDAQKWHIFEMRCLRSILGVTRRDHIKQYNSRNIKYKRVDN